MSTEVQNLNQFISITEPGEKNQDNHLFGDRLMISVSNVVAWIFPLLIVAIVTQVIIRKAGFNQAWLDDAQWWMYGFAMLTGFGYAITTESHVRVDILHQNYSPKRKARIEVFAHGWLLLPFLALMTDILMHYAFASIKASEGSDSPNGLHMLYILKTSLPILFLLAIIASWTVLCRHLKILGKTFLYLKIIASLPFLWFVAERFVFYALWWFIRLSNPDLNHRNIARDPMVSHTVEMGLGLLIILFIVSYLRTQKLLKG